MISAEETMELHSALCGALGVPKWPLSFSDVNKWEWFLLELKGLEETDGGKLTPRDVIAVVNLMRVQKRKQGTGWSLRYNTILSKPEQFRDLVFETRRKIRPRPPEQPTAALAADGRTAFRPDPKPESAAQADTAAHVWEAGQREFAAMKERIGRRRP